MSLADRFWIAYPTKSYGKGLNEIYQTGNPLVASYYMHNVLWSTSKLISLICYYEEVL